MQIDLRHLRYFIAVAEELSFTRAAERLHIGQPPLSMQIRDLEERLGVRLLDRNKRRVALTEAGCRFLERARDVLARMEAAVDEARRLGRGELGVLRVGFTSSLPYTSTLPELLFRYRRQFPGVELQLAEMFTREQFAAIAQGQLDVGLVRSDASAAREGIAMRRIGEDALRLVLPASHPLAGRKTLHLAELAGEDFITFSPDVGTELPDLLHQLCKAAGFAPRIVQTAREATTQIGLVAAGLGIALLPAPLESVALSRVRYLALADPGAHFSLSVAYREGEAGPLVEGFLKVLEGLQG